MKHFSHPHDLYFASLMPSAENKNIACFGCKLPLFGTCYTCSGCQFYLHKFCFELPQFLHYKPHPNHTLALLYPPYCHGQCESCGDSCNGFTYNCSLCSYNVHASCAGLFEIETKDDPDKYATMFLWYKLSELKSVRGELWSMRSMKQNGEAEEAYKRQQMMKAELQKARQNMHMQQLQRMSDSIDFMNRI